MNLDSVRRVLKNPQLPDGLVVKYQRNSKTYVALLLNGRWWITGNPYPRGTASFVDDLATAEDIQVATGWEAL